MTRRPVGTRLILVTSPCSWGSIKTRVGVRILYGTWNCMEGVCVIKRIQVSLVSDVLTTTDKIHTDL